MSTSEAKIPQPALEAWGLLKDEFPNIGLEHLFKQGVDVGKAWQEIYKLRHETSEWELLLNEEDPKYFDVEYCKSFTYLVLVPACWAATGYMEESREEIKKHCTELVKKLKDLKQSPALMWMANSAASPLCINVWDHDTAENHVESITFEDVILRLTNIARMFAKGEDERLRLSKNLRTKPIARFIRRISYSIKEFFGEDKFEIIAQLSTAYTNYEQVFSREDVDKLVAEWDEKDTLLNPGIIDDPFDYLHIANPRIFSS